MKVYQWIMLITVSLVSCLQAVPVRKKCDKVSGTVERSLFRGTFKYETVFSGPKEQEEGKTTSEAHIIIPISFTPYNWYKKREAAYIKGDLLYLYIPMSKEQALKIKAGEKIEISGLEMFVNDLLLVSCTYKDIKVAGKSILEKDS